MPYMYIQIYVHVHNMRSTMLGKAHCSPLATANLSSSGVVAAPTERMESYKNMKILHVHGYYQQKINSKQEYGARV